MSDANFARWALDFDDMDCMCRHAIDEHNDQPDGFVRECLVEGCDCQEYDADYERDALRNGCPTTRYAYIRDPGHPDDNATGHLPPDDAAFPRCDGPGQTAEMLAQMFHEHYERLAPRYGYRTREDSAVPWKDVPQKNRALMIETARCVLRALERSEPATSTT